MKLTSQPNSYPTAGKSAGAKMSTNMAQIHPTPYGLATLASNYHHSSAEQSSTQMSDN